MILPLGNAVNVGLWASRNGGSFIREFNLHLSIVYLIDKAANSPVEAQVGGTRQTLRFNCPVVEAQGLF